MWYVIAHLYDINGGSLLILYHPICRGVMNSSCNEMMTSKTGLIHSVSKQTSGLKVDWKNGETSLFHYVWLRDCCYCEECGDCYSSLRRYVPSIASLKSQPHSITWDDLELRIEWANEPHHSSYSANWLNNHRYDDKARNSRRLKKSTWNASLDLSEVSFDFEKVNNDETSRFELQVRLISNGVAIVRRGPSSPGSVTAFAKLAGEVEHSAYGTIFDLSPNNAVGTAGTTFREIPPHSDEAFAYNPPGIAILACVHPADDGGDSILVDGFGIAEKLRESFPSGFEYLANWNHHYVRLHPNKLDQRARAPIIALDSEGEISGIRLHTRSSAPLDLPEHIMEGYLEAYHRLCSMMMDPDNQIRVSLDAGDAIIFDNHRALHARSAFSDRSRFLQICSVPRENFHQSFRLLASHLGQSDSANMVLSAGVCR